MKKLPASRKSADLKAAPLALEPVLVEPVLLEKEAPLRNIPCAICASDTQFGSPENMCWVCRRLKISAWRDVEQQMPAQE